MWAEASSATLCGAPLPNGYERGEIIMAQPTERIHSNRIELTSPNGGEHWSVDSQHWITWTSVAGISAVKIEFSTDGGDAWATAISVADGRTADSVSSLPDQTNKFLWKVPPQLTSRCRVRISTPQHTSVGDASDADFSIIPSQESESYRWTSITLKAPFAGRDGAGAVVFKSRMWLLGGWNLGDRISFPDICNSEVWSSADGLNWILEVPQAPWEGRHTAGYVGYDNKIWIVGGDANQHHYQNDVWNTKDGVHWTLVNDCVPWRPRVLHYTLVHNRKIWVMGGQTLPQFAPSVPEEVFYNDVWNSHDGVSWTQVTQSAAWAPRGMIGGYVVFKDRMWILGGGTYDTPSIPARTFYNEVWSSADGVDWKRHVEFAPWQPRQYHDVAVFDGKMWVLEGYDGDSNRDDVWYSSDGANWYELPNTPWAPRHAASVFTYDHALWVVAGNNMFPDVWRLTSSIA